MKKFTIWAKYGQEKKRLDNYSTLNSAKLYTNYVRTYGLKFAGLHKLPDDVFIVVS